MAPRVRAELRRVVVRLPGPHHSVVRYEVPFLAGDLAGLAADADRGVGEEADPFLRLRAIGAMRVHAAPPRTRAGASRAGGGPALSRPRTPSPPGCGRS